MSRSMHWMLLGGCVSLTALFTPLAWHSVFVCEVPSDCRFVLEAEPGGAQSGLVLGTLEAPERLAVSPD